MSLPVTAVRAASFVVTMVLVGLAYPVLAGLVYLGLLVASATGDQGMGGPLAGPVIVLLGAAVGALCVAIAAPAALAARVVGGLKGVLAGSAVLVFLTAGATWLAWLLFDLSGNPGVTAAVLVVAATPAALVLALSDALAGMVAGLRLRTSPRAAEA
ncbi:hypothetical protein SAMN05428985_105448 [Nocardioides sp. YR527]|uniref:hypothetical protein n=1 Tax=Nocardioides sp. YR527 TaxID=1881028 RepID=UPI00088B7EEA|nr:hypothetical protein [Nocardioides sp. YR527]SDK72073.1 hypothetical protein SAMN05428985_105448 [Nocardioides sp. YR527]